MNKPILPKNVAFILEKINKAGYEAYIVGGCVRDSLMGRTPSDWDITTSATPKEIKDIFSHTVDTGIKHGTVTIVMDKENYEVTTYRIEGAYEDCRHPSSVSFTRDLHEDLLRRDFTVNAIAYNPQEGYVDIFDGVTDIEQKTIRGVGEPGERFREDALRMLRAVRFSVQLDFKIEEKTKAAVIENGKLIEKISAERIREELTKTLTGDYTQNMTYLWETELLKHISVDLFDITKSKIQDIIKQLKKVDKNIAASYAIFIHTMPIEGAKKFLKSLKFDTKTLRLTEKLLENIDVSVKTDDASVRLVASALGREECLCLYKTKLALGEKKAELALETLKRVLLAGDALTVKELNITGENLIEMGFSQGKDIGTVLNLLLSEVIKNPQLNSFDMLKNKAEEIYFNR